MIYDRTQEDVNSALELRETKIKKFIALNETELETMERGALTINTLNRIEDKQLELKNLLNDIGYYDVDITTKVWAKVGNFTETDLRRLISNCDKLKKGFYTYYTTPKTPAVTYHFETINAIEKILEDIDLMISEVKSYFRQCGTFVCGER